MDPLSFLFYRLYYFFRDPERTPPDGRVIVSPSDGRVLYVKSVESGAIPSPVKQGVDVPLEEWTGGGAAFEGGGTLVGIYMSPLSVHYTRAAIGGVVARIVHRRARTENLSMARSLIRLIWNMPPFEKDSRYITENARSTIFTDGEIPTAIIHIADRYVREVDCLVEEGEDVGTGSRVGLIRMGSQVDLLIPDRPDIVLSCRPGDRVRAGETVLGTY